MSEETTEAVEDTKDTGKGLRAQLEVALAKVKKNDDRERIRSFKAIGLNVDEGYGKAIALSYDGEPTEEAVAAYAKDEFGYVHQVDPQTHPQAAQIQDQQQRLDQIGQTAGSVTTPSQNDVLAKAEAEGDYGTTMAIKGQQVADMFRTGR